MARRAKKHIDGSVSLQAPAKINLFLHITGRRVNGFHELESLFVFTETGDKITLNKNDVYKLTLKGEFANALVAAGGAGGDNLVSKAVFLMAEKTGQSANVHITLEKHLPIAAGIGGGSSDAAATMMGLLSLWDCKMSGQELEDIAFELGADVPSCLHSNPVYVRGIGELMQEAAIPKAYGILLVNTGAVLSTPKVFEAYKAAAHSEFDKPFGNMPPWPLDEDAFLKFLKDDTHNTLQGPAIGECEDIAPVIAALVEQSDELYTGMSGSGTTCFALFDDLASAKHAEQEVKSSNPNWWVKADRLTTG